MCLKKIKPEPAYFDQSLTEIHVLEYLKKHGCPRKRHFIEIYEHFYYNVS